MFWPFNRRGETELERREAEDRAWAGHWQRQMDNAQEASMHERMEYLMETARLKSIATEARPQCRPQQMTQEMWEGLREREPAVPRLGSTGQAMQNVTDAFEDVGRAAAASLRDSFEQLNSAFAGMARVRPASPAPPVTPRVSTQQERAAQRATCYDELEDSERTALAAGYRALGQEFRPETVDYRPERSPVQERQDVAGDAWVERSSFGGSHSYVNLGGWAVCIAQTVTRTTGYSRDLLTSAIRASLVGANRDRQVTVSRVMQAMDRNEFALTLENLAGVLEIYHPEIEADRWFAVLCTAQAAKVADGSVQGSRIIPERAAVQEPRFSAEVTITYETMEAHCEHTHYGRMRTPDSFRNVNRGGWVFGSLRVENQEAALALELAAAVYGPRGLQLIAALPNREIIIQRNPMTRCFEYGFTSTDRAAIEALTGARQVPTVQTTQAAVGTITDSFEVDVLNGPNEAGANGIATGPNTTYEGIPVLNRASARMAHWLWEHHRDYVNQHRGAIVSLRHEYTSVPPTLTLHVTRRTQLTVPIQQPEVPAQSERRLKLTHKQRNKVDVSHKLDSSSKDHLNRGITRRRRRDEN